MCTRFLRAAGKKAGEQAAAAYAVRKVAKAEDDENPSDERITEILAAIELEWEQLGRDVTPLLQAAASVGVNLGVEQLGGLGTVTAEVATQARSHAWAWAADRGADLVGMKRQADGEFVENPDAQWAIPEAYREELKEEIRTAFEEAWSPKKLAAAIEKSVAFSPERAATIAKTEITRAQAQGNLASWVKSGVILKVAWQTSADHKCCDECDDYEEQGEVEPGHEFAPGVTAPGAHPNCNCALVVKKVKE